MKQFLNLVNNAFFSHKSGDFKKTMAVFLSAGKKSCWVS